MKKRLLNLFTITTGGLMSIALMACNNSSSTTGEQSSNTKPSEPAQSSSTGASNNSSSNNASQETFFEVKYDVLGHGTAPRTQAIDEGEKAVKPENPIESGWKFKGWYKDSELTEIFDFNSAVTENITLYAKWKEYKGVNYDTDKTPTIFLAGDSTVQTYAEEQYIGGWGQYFNWFLDEDVKVVNCARGGRSSRSFINEGRLFDEGNYTFSENGGKSIEESIKEGDYLFVQFGHNDDDTKEQSDTSYKYERFVTLGEPDQNGIYPTIEPQTKVSTSENLPSDMTDKTKTEIAKYGSQYYSYDSTGQNGTYKGYLKQYIDLARSKGAIPVLCTPVARVSFDSNGKIQGGPGRHGDDFAYVKAVRQLAEEEKCLLIDNFEFSKKALETATKDFSDFLMAIVPNTLANGPWPQGFDSAYKNASLGYEKMEGTHYNKYGAFLTAGFVAESIIKADMNGITTGKNNVVEYFNFVEHVLENAYKYINPSNRLSISKANEIEALFEEINVTDPEREYVQADVAIEAIEALKARGGLDQINGENWEEWVGYCEIARAVYESLNYDLRDGVTNYDDLVAYETASKAARPQAIKVAVMSMSALSEVADGTSLGGQVVTNSDHTFTFVDNTGANKKLQKYKKSCTAFEFNQQNYEATTSGILLGGNNDYYIEFAVTGKCDVTIVGLSGGSDTRTIKVTNVENSADSYAFDAASGQATVTNTFNNAGTYRLKSGGSNIYLFYIIIEYFE